MGARRARAAATRWPCAASRAAAASPPDPGPDHDDPRHVSSRPHVRRRGARRRGAVALPRQLPPPVPAPRRRQQPEQRRDRRGVGQRVGPRPPAAVARRPAPGSPPRRRSRPARPGTRAGRPAAAPRRPAPARAATAADAGAGPNAAQSDLRYPARRSAQPSYIRHAARSAPSATPTRPPERLTARATARSSSTSAATPANPPARASAAASTTRNCPLAAHSAGLRGPLGPAQRQRHHPRPLQQRLHQPGRGAVGELARPRREQVEPGAAQHRDRGRDGVRRQQSRRRRRTPARSRGPRPRAGRRRAACPGSRGGGGVPRSSRSRGSPSGARAGRRPPVPSVEPSSRTRSSRSATPRWASSAASVGRDAVRLVAHRQRDGHRLGHGGRVDGRDAQRPEVDAPGAACRHRERRPRAHERPRRGGGHHGEPGRRCGTRRRARRAGRRRARQDRGITASVDRPVRRLRCGTRRPTGSPPARAARPTRRTPMSRPTAVPLPRGVLGGPRAAAPPVRLLLPWVLVGAAVLVQIVYPLVPDAVRTEITVASVLVFCAAAVADAARVHGPRGAAVLLAVAGGGGLLVEAVGVHTGRPVRRLRLHRRPRRRGARRARGGAAGLGDDGLARAGRRPDAGPSPAGGAGRRRGAGGVGPVPRPADGRRRALDVGAPAPRAAARAGRAADELRGLAAGRPWSWSGRWTGCCPGTTGRPARPRRCTCGPTARPCWRTWCSSTGRARRWSAGCVMGVLALPFARALWASAAQRAQSA